MCEKLPSIHLSAFYFVFLCVKCRLVCVCGVKTVHFSSCFSDFGGGGEEVEIVEVQEYVGDPAYGTATTQLHKAWTTYSRTHIHLQRC